MVRWRARQQAQRWRPRPGLPPRKAAARKHRHSSTAARSASSSSRTSMRSRSPSVGRPKAAGPRLRPHPTLSAAARPRPRRGSAPTPRRHGQTRTPATLAVWQAGASAAQVSPAQRLTSTTVLKRGRRRVRRRRRRSVRRRRRRSVRRRRRRSVTTAASAGRLALMSMDGTMLAVAATAARAAARMGCCRAHSTHVTPRTPPPRGSAAARPLPRPPSLPLHRRQRR